MKFLVFVVFLVGFRSVFAVTPQIQIVTTFSILEDIAIEVGGPEVNVSSLVKRGQDPHSFEPRARDLQRLKNADLIFLVGLGFEPWFSKTSESVKIKKSPLVLSDGLTAISVAQFDDPHLWLNPDYAISMSQKIAEALSLVRPESKSVFLNRQISFSERLLALKKKYSADFSKLKSEQRKIAVTHQAFAYLGKAFDLDFFAPTYIGHGGDAGPKTLSAFLAKIKSHQLKGYFSVYGHPQTISREMAQDNQIKELGILYAESLSEPSGSAPTYLKMMEHNLDLLKSSISR